MRMFFLFFFISFSLTYIQLAFKIDFLLIYIIFSIGWFGSIIFDTIKKDTDDKR